jgi:hypothetical protein
LAAPLFADEVVAPGPPPLTRPALERVTGFLEWALDLHLTVDEREQFERVQIDNWNKGNEAARQTIESLLKTADAVDKLPANAKGEFRQQMRKALLETLRKTPDTPAARVVLGAWQRNQEKGGADFPPELVGEWSSVHTSTVNYVDRGTGSYAPPSGTGTSYTILPDGQYKSASLIQSSMYNCTMTVNAYEEGVLRLNGNVVVFDSKGGTLDSKDNCNSRFNYRKPIPANQTTYNWRLERDQWGVKFCIVKPGVKEDCAYKK